jgi:hypothetical protein
MWVAYGPATMTSAGKPWLNAKASLTFTFLLTGRLWLQLGSLRREARYPFLLVEGIRLLRTTNQKDSALWLFRLAVLCQRQSQARQSS